MSALLINSAHALALLLAVSIPISLLDGTLFSWHPSLMAIGFLGLMAEGVLASISFRSLEGNERLRKIWLHFAWQIVAITCVIGGFTVIYRNKVIHGKAHFQSLHGKFGVTTFSLALAAAAGGALAFRRFGVTTKLPEKLQPRVKAVHRNVGLVVWLLALVTVELALTHKAVWKGAPNRAWMAGVPALGAAVAGFAWQQRLRAGRKLPVYEPGPPAQHYGVVSAAEELTKTV